MIFLALFRLPRSAAPQRPCNQPCSRRLLELADTNDTQEYELWRQAGGVSKPYNILVYTTRAGKPLAVVEDSHEEIDEEVLTWCLKLKRDIGQSRYTVIQRALLHGKHRAEEHHLPD